MSPALSHAALWIGSVLFFGSLSLVVGMNVTWDTRNYHFYNAYSLLHHRMGLDWAPAQLQNFLNPGLDVLPYWMMRHWPAPLTGFFLGAVQGLNFALITETGLSLWQRIWPESEVWKWWGLSLAGAAFGCYGPGFLVELGSLSQDNVISLFVLGALWLVILADDRQTTAGRLGSIALAGLLIGLGTGFKLTTALYAVALFFALPFRLGSGRARLPALALLTVFGSLGLAISGGWWMMLLQQKFGSPLFPYFNHIFQSEWVPPLDFRDPAWPPASFWQGVIFPWKMASLAATGCEQVYREGRYLLGIAALLGAMFFLPGGAGKAWAGGRPDLRAVLFLGVFSVVAWVTGITLYGYMRYMVPLELIVPLLVLVIAGIGGRAGGLVVGAIVLLGLNAVWLRPPAAERIAWQNRYFQVTPPQLSPDSLVVIMGGEPRAYVIPYFDPAIRFVRPEGSLMQKAGAPGQMETTILDIVRSHRGPVYVLMADHSAAGPSPFWDAVGRTPGEPALPVATNIETLKLIPMLPVR